MAARRGVLMVVVLIAVLGVSVLLASLALRRPSTAGDGPTVLVFDAPSTLEEADPGWSGNPLDLMRRERPGVWEIARGLRHAADDSRVEALVLHVDGIDWGWAKTAEIRDAVMAFRRAGKPVYASLARPGEPEYFLGSAAERIALAPLDVLQLDGLAAAALFLRGGLDKLDVTPNFASVGQYKSGVEMWTRRDMSAPSREALQQLLDDDFSMLVDTLAAARGIAPAAMRALVDEGPFGAEDAHRRGLVDTLLYRADLDSLAVGRRGHRRSTTTLDRYLRRVEPSRVGTHVALLYAVGTIAEGRSRRTPGEGTVLGSETIIKALRDVRDRESIKVVVLRVDSPGGDAQASDEIWREVERCRRRKPVIASFSDLAASGGYYIAAGANSIVAAPGTLTGSIGVFGGKLNLLGLYRKLGLNVETVSRGRHAEMFSSYKDFTPEEAERFAEQMDVVYRAFVDRVARGRGLDTAAVNRVGQGRIWSGTAGRARGLVDVLGGLEEAFAVARARVGLQADAPIVVDVYPRVERTFLQRFFADLVPEDDDTAFTRALPPVMQAWFAATRFPSGAVLALMPYHIEIR